MVDYWDDSHPFLRPVILPLLGGWACSVIWNGIFLGDRFPPPPSIQFVQPSNFVCSRRITPRGGGRRPKTPRGQSPIIALRAVAPFDAVATEIERETGTEGPAFPWTTL